MSLAPKDLMKKSTFFTQAACYRLAQFLVWHLTTERSAQVGAWKCKIMPDRPSIIGIGTSVQWSIFEGFDTTITPNAYQITFIGNYISL